MCIVTPSHGRYPLVTGKPSISMGHGATMAMLVYQRVHWKVYEIGFTTLVGIYGCYNYIWDIIYMGI